jgi:hypothetical protein
VEVRRLAAGPAKLDHAVGAILSQVRGQVDSHSMQFGKVLAPMSTLAGAEIEPKPHELWGRKWSRFSSGSVLD